MTKAVEPNDSTAFDYLPPAEEFELRFAEIEFGVCHVIPPGDIESGHCAELKRTSDSGIGHDEVHHIIGAAISQAGIVNPLHALDAFGKESPDIVDR